MSDGRRRGGEPLHLTPAHNQPFRWLPRHGEPSWIGEWFAQWVVRALAWAPLYTALVTTLALLVLLFGVPFVEER